ncbi:MAG: hypothetical protein ACRCWJ_19030 [Casimicrobium sp.]
MPRSKRPRKPRNVRKTHGDTRAITRLLGSTEALPLENAIDVAIFARNSLEALRTGRCDDDHFGALANVTNIGMLLAERGIGEEALPAFKAAQYALLTLRQRFETRGRYVATASELATLREAIDYHELQVQHSTIAEVRDAIITMNERLQAKQIMTIADVLPATCVQERKAA